MLVIYASKQANTNTRYSESINLIYSDNTFTTTSVEVITALPLTILASRLGAIRSLRFSWPVQCPPYAAFDAVTSLRDEWLRVWKCLSEMRGLHMLRVELFHRIPQTGAMRVYLERELHHPTWANLREEDLEKTVRPIREVTIPEDFELDLRLQSVEYQAAWGTLPCRVVSR